MFKKSPNPIYDWQYVRIVDTEGTHSNPDESELIELAVGKIVTIPDNSSFELEIQSRLFKPIKLIPPEASAINNISNRMVEHKKQAIHSVPDIDNMLYGDQATAFDRQMVFVAHNAKYDYKALAKYSSLSNSLESSWICTWRLAQQILKDQHSNIHYNLAYLRYFLDLNVSDDLVAHRADADITICFELLMELINLGIDNGKLDPNKNIIKQCVELSWQPIIQTHWPFGKHKGTHIDDIPTSYFSWALENMDCLNPENPAFDGDLAASVLNRMKNS